MSILTGTYLYISTPRTRERTEISLYYIFLDKAKDIWQETMREDLLVDQKTETELPTVKNQKTNQESFCKTTGNDFRLNRGHRH